MHFSLLLISHVVSVIAGPVVPRDDTTATVELSVPRGQPQHLASGFLYGIPAQEGQIPDHWYTDINFRRGRTGGGQLGAPNRGWTWGLSEYQGRLASTLSDYRTMRKFGAECHIYTHDLWGTDSSNSSSYWPGDGGDWTQWDNFLTRLKDDLVANNALEGLVWDIWNEPDVDIFWKRDTQQWIDLYIRTHKIIRADSRFATVPLTGPSMALRPQASNTWWTSWLQAVAAANTVPDQYTYHLEGGVDAADNDPQFTNASLRGLLQQYGLPERQVCINEYALFEQMLPSGYAWWISRLERFDFPGILGNWMGGPLLHDLQANLLTKWRDGRDAAATDYAPAPGHHVYRYYAQNMTGARLPTAASNDGILDVYATRGADRVRLLAGPKIRAGRWAIRVDGLASAGYPAEGTIDVEAWEFLGSDPFAVAAPPAFVQKQTYTYTGGSVTIPVSQNNNFTAHAFEFDVKQ